MTNFEKAFWQEVVESADSIIVVVDPLGRIRLFNRKAQEITGYSAEEVLGKAWIETFVPAEYRLEIQRVLKALLDGKRIPRFGKYPILSKDGKEILIAWDRSFVKDKSEKTNAILSVGHDLSLPTVIEEERYHMKTILDGIADGVFTVDLNLRITSFNNAASTITGFSEEEALGQHCRDIFRGSMCSHQCPLMELIETGKDSGNMEGDILNKENKEIPVSFNTTLRRDRNGKPIGGICIFRDLTPIVELKKELQEKYSFQDIISRSKAFLEIFRILPDIALSDAAVLITGESGTGKELIATALHRLSRRKEKPFIKVNCGALPETLLESELFGYKRGAFTDAKQDKPGRFKLAEDGTIFLDEIGEISQGTQVKLLRVLEAKEYEPLGGTKTEKANVRIISATNQNLWSRVRAGEFREDLYYRLNLFTIDLPPLRDRREDIPLLIDHFLKRFNHTRGKDLKGFTHSALEILLNHDYPGNVRELQNIIEHAYVLSKKNHIGPESLPIYLRKRYPSEDGHKGRKTVEEFEKELILETLRKNNGKIQDAAEEIGIHRATLWRKMKRMKIAS